MQSKMVPRWNSVHFWNRNPKATQWSHSMPPTVTSTGPRRNQSSNTLVCHIIYDLHLMGYPDYRSRSPCLYLFKQVSHTSIDSSEHPATIGMIAASPFASRSGLHGTMFALMVRVSWLLDRMTIHVLYNQGYCMA